MTSGNGPRAKIRRIGSAIVSGALFLGGLGVITSSPAQATTAFTNYTTANGLGDVVVRGVYVVGSTVYAATNGGGLSISTDGGTTFTNRTKANSGLGNNILLGV